MGANSTQSLRIRNLEAEVSRLLAENVSLREQIIKLQAQVDRDGSRQALENVKGVKRMLEGKLRELGDLVGGLGAISLDVSPGTFRARRSPEQDQKDWKNTFTLSEVTSNQEGRLPPILEDKLYPRRSIDSNEPHPPISDHVSAPDSSLSPEIGPPPIAHFDEEPIAFNPDRRVDVGSTLGTDIGDGTAAYQPVNLEKRKKRRDSAKLSEILNPTEAPQHGQRQLSMTENQVVDADAGQPLRAGAKRKLSMRDEDEKPKESFSVDLDDFKFSRRVTTGRGRDEHRPKSNTQPIGKKGSSESIQESGTVCSINSEKPKKQTPVTSGRKALGPKNINTDPVSSPVKIGKVAALEDVAQKEAAKKAAAIEHYKVCDKRPLVAAVRPKPKRPDVNVVELEPSRAQSEPETPRPPDVLSPTDSRPSTVRPISRDTPPPPDLDPSSATADGLISAARATRRPRGSINYAEPNLRDKMRRPTKELVDAVTGEGKGHRISGVKMEGSRSADEEGSANDRTHIRTVVIKREEVSDQSWKKLQLSSSINKEASTTVPGRAYKTAKSQECEDGSPLNSKSRGNNLGELVTQRRRRTSALHRDDEEFAVELSAAVAPPELKKKPSRGGDRRTDIAIQNAMEKLQALDIYDFKGSSPSTAGDSSAAELPTKSSRRPSPLDAEGGDSDTDAASNGSSSRRGGGAGKRRQTLAGNVRPGDGGGVRATRSVVTLTVGPDVCGDGGGGDGGARAAGRRRSMML